MVHIPMRLGFMEETSLGHGVHSNKGRALFLFQQFWNSGRSYIHSLEDCYIHNNMNVIFRSSSTEHRMALIQFCSDSVPFSAPPKSYREHFKSGALPAWLETMGLSQGFMIKWRLCGRLMVYRCLHKILQIKGWLVSDKRLNWPSPHTWFKLFNRASAG